MVVRIDKNMTSKDIQAALNKLKDCKQNQNLSNFYGKLKGIFGDGLEYQKRVRNGM